MVVISVKRIRELENLCYDSLVTFSKDPLIRDFFFEDLEFKIPKKQLHIIENLHLIANKMNVSPDELEAYIFFQNHAQRFAEEHSFKNLHQDFLVPKEFARQHNLNAEEFVDWISDHYLSTIQVLGELKDLGLID